MSRRAWGPSPRSLGREVPPSGAPLPPERVKKCPLFCRFLRIGKASLVGFFSILEGGDSELFARVRDLARPPSLPLARSPPRSCSPSGPRRAPARNAYARRAAPRCTPASLCSIGRDESCRCGRSGCVRRSRRQPRVARGGLSLSSAATTRGREDGGRALLVAAGAAVRASVVRRTRRIEARASARPFDVRRGGRPRWGVAATRSPSSATARRRSSTSSPRGGTAARRAGATPRRTMR